VGRRRPGHGGQAEVGGDPIYGRQGHYDEAIDQLPGHCAALRQRLDPYARRRTEQIDTGGIEL